MTRSQPDPANPDRDWPWPMSPQPSSHPDDDRMGDPSQPPPRPHTA